MRDGLPACGASSAAVRSSNGHSRSRAGLSLIISSRRPSGIFKIPTNLHASVTSRSREASGAPSGAPAKRQAPNAPCGLMITGRVRSLGRSPFISLLYQSSFTSRFCSRRLRLKALEAFVTGGDTFPKPLLSELHRARDPARPRVALGRRPWLTSGIPGFPQSCC